MTVRNLRAVATALLLGTATLAGAALVATPAAAALRASIGKPLQEAQSLAAAGNWRAAAAKVSEAEAVSGKSAEESNVIAQMKKYIAVSSGDTSTAEGAKAKFSNDYNARKYKDVIADAEMLRKNGALGAQEMLLVAQAYYQSGDKAGCERYIKSNIPNPSDTGLELLMRCAYDAGDEATQRSALETLVSHTGKAEYWSSLLKLSERAQGMRDPDTLDIYRLKLLTGTISGKEEYVTLAQVALQLGFPSEAQAALEKGIAAKVLIADDRTNKLVNFARTQAGAKAASMGKDLAAANAAPTGDALIKIGQDQWGQGKAKDAVATIQAGLKKPVADKNGAAIHLGMAQIAAGQKADAIKTLDAVKGPAGNKVAMIAHLWSLYARH